MVEPLKGLCQLESMRVENMQITFNCQNSIVFNARLPVTSKAPKCLMRRLQVWITDLLIEFTERFLSGYARKSSLKFFVENKSGKTILLVVLRLKRVPFIKI